MDDVIILLSLGGLLTALLKKPPPDGNGGQGWVPSDAMLWFSTDFSTTTAELRNDKLYFSDFPEVSEYYINQNVPWQQCYLFEYILGKRALRIRWGDSLIVDGENPRPTCLLYNTPNEYWIETELYLPADFKLKRWMSIFQPFTGRYDIFPRFSSSLFLGGYSDIENGFGSITIQHQVRYQGERTNGVPPYQDVWDYKVYSGLVKRGEPLVIRAHVKQSRGIDGICELWINDTKLTDYHGQTQTDASNEIVPFQQYKRVDEPVTSIWWKNIQIWMR